MHKDGRQKQGYGVFPYEARVEKRGLAKTRTLSVRTKKMMGNQKRKEYHVAKPLSPKECFSGVGGER